MFHYCQRRCCSPGLILVQLEMTIPSIWLSVTVKQCESRCERNEMQSENCLSLLSPFPICPCAAHLHPAGSSAGIGRESSQVTLQCAADRAGTPTAPDRRTSGEPQEQKQWIYFQDEAALAPLAQRDHFSAAQGIGILLGIPQQHGMLLSATHASAFLFQTREEGEEVGICWLWGASCQHSCSAKWLHVQENPSACCRDLPTSVHFPLELHHSWRWPTAGRQQLSGCVPVSAHSKLGGTPNFLLLLQ